MTSIVADHVRVEYPILQSPNRSLKRRFMSTATGGRIARDARDHVVVTALDDVSFTIAPGDRVALVGHNGSGKTTLLRSIAGVYRPVGGRLEVTGTIASLFDISIGFDPEATGRENVFLRGLVMGMTRRQLAELMEGIHEFTGLGDYFDFPIRTYSTGMLLRLAFSVVTCRHRDIVLMDEGLSVGDADFALHAERRMREYVDNSSILIVATHSEQIVSRFCNRKIQLNHGHIVSDEKIG